VILLSTDSSVTSYAFRYGFADHLLQKLELPDSFVKKLMNHSPNSKYLRDCYEGDQRADILSIREALPKDRDIEMDLFGKAYVWRVEKPRELTEEEMTELKEYVLKNDKRAKGFYDEMNQLMESASLARKEKNRARWTEYRKKLDVVKSSFYGRMTVHQRKKLKEIRRNELDELIATMTLDQLRERAFNPPEGRRQFKTRIDCLASVFFSRFQSHVSRQLESLTSFIFVFTGIL
jgi:hypothetical protein